MKVSSAIICLTLLTLTQSYAQPKTSFHSKDDIHSIEQEERDEAAADLRQSYEAAPKSKWDEAMKKLQKGLNKKKLEEIFGIDNSEVFMSLGSGQSHAEMYQLDNDWMLNCWFENDGNSLMSWELTAHTKSIWIAPPANDFTGTWITYYVNGQKANEIEYKNGRYHGTFTSYHSDGSKSVVQHYNEKGCNGSDKGYYPSGKLKYEGMYKNSQQCGTWTHYDKDGNVTSSKNEGDC